MPGPTKSKKLHVIQGTYRKSRHDKKEPEPVAGFPIAPPWLGPSAVEIWNDIHRTMEATGVLTQADQMVLASFCVLCAKIADAERNGEILPASYYAVMATTANKLGLDPSSRARLAKPEAPKPADEWASFG